MVTDAIERDTSKVESAAPAVVGTNTRPVVTVEKALYGLLVLAAAIVRLVHLGLTPMTATETGQAFQAYRLATGAGLPTGDYSPLLLTFNFLTFALLGGVGDALPRLLPALAGSAIVAVPYWLRRWLGRPGALATAGLLAFTPSFVLFSRWDNEAVVTALFTLAVLTIGQRYLLTPIPRRLTWLGVWLAVALVSGRGAWLFVVVALGFILAVMYSGRDSVTREDILAGLRAMRDNRGTLLSTVVIALGLFVALATALFFNPDGIQAALDGLAAWFRVPMQSEAWWYYLLALPVYETAILVLGLVGGVWLLTQRNLFALFLIVWFAVALALSTLSPARPASGIVTILLPLTLLAGMTLGRMVDALRLYGSWTREGLFLLIALPFIVGPALQVAAFVTQPQATPGAETRLLLILALFVVFLGAILSAFAAMMGRDVAWRSAGALALVLLALITIRTTASVTYPQAYVPQEFLGGPRTSLDATRVAGDIYGVALDRFGASQTQLVAVDERLTPAMAWYLRLFPSLDIRNNVVGSTATQLLAAVPAGAQPPQAPAGYVGQPARFESAWSPLGMDARNWIRWYVYRETPVNPPRVDGLVWFAKPTASAGQ